MSTDRETSSARFFSYGTDRVKREVFWLTVSDGKITRIKEQFRP